MAARSFFLTLTRNGLRRKNIALRSISSSSETAPAEVPGMGADELVLDSSMNEGKDDLRSRIFRLRLPKRSVTNALEKWVAEGRHIVASDLRSISRDLRRSRRYKHALEISEWMVSHEEYQLSDSDYAFRIDLMAKVFGIDAAERYFEALPSTEKTSETYTALLHCYAVLKLVDQVEELFKRINEDGVSLSSITYNELMTLYMSVGQLEKIPPVIEEMKVKNVALDLFTYNLWISSCAASLNIDEIRRILDTMSVIQGCDETYSKYIKLTKVYIFAGGLVNQDPGILIETEKGAITQRELISYDFLVILYGAIGNNEKLDQVWKSLRAIDRRLTGRNYICILSTYLMNGMDKEVLEVIEQWKLSAGSEFNISMCNKLMEALGDVGLGTVASQFRGILHECGCDASNGDDAATV